MSATKLMDPKLIKVAAAAMRQLPLVASKLAEAQEKLAKYERRERIEKIAGRLLEGKEATPEFRADLLAKLGTFTDEQLSSVEVSSGLLGAELAPNPKLGTAEETPEHGRGAGPSSKQDADDAYRRMADHLLAGPAGLADTGT